MDTLFKINNISSGYVDKTILNDISFNINRGEFFGILGPNGSGKTTLLKTLTRALKPFSGNIHYKDEDVSGISLKQLAKDIAFVPQETFTAFSFSVMDIVLMGRYPHLGRFQVESRRDREIAHNALESVKCLDFADKDISNISAGERQRVIIAKALAQEPKVLILDEPTSRLDIGHQVEIFDIIKKLNTDKNITVIAVLHDLNLASDYCNRIMFINEGRVFDIGTVNKILTYQNIEMVYNTTVIVNESAATKKPHITLVPKYK